MLSVTKRVQIGTKRSLGEGGMDGRRHGRWREGGREGVKITWG